MILQDLVARFLDVMRDERTVYSGLLIASENKKEAIQAKETKELDAIVRQEQALVLRLGQIEKRRMQCLEGLAAKTGVGLDDITMLSFGEYGTPEQAQDLRELHGILEKMLKRLADRNDENRLLLEAKIEYVNFAVDVLTSDQNPGLYNTLGSDAFSGKDGQNIMDRKV